MSTSYHDKLPHPLLCTTHWPMYQWMRIFNHYYDTISFPPDPSLPVPAGQLFGKTQVAPYEGRQQPSPLHEFIFLSSTLSYTGNYYYFFNVKETVLCWDTTTRKSARQNSPAKPNTQVSVPMAKLCIISRGHKNQSPATYYNKNGFPSADKQENAVLRGFTQSHGHCQPLQRN